MTDWDLVIVGAGSAGATLAARMSENPARRVLLIEAGPDYRSDQTPAATSGKSVLGAVAAPGRIWPHLLATRVPGREPALYFRGRGVGGSSAVNAQVAIRGLPEDYDRWEAVGCAGWGWSGVSDSFETVAANIPAERAPRNQWSSLDQGIEVACIARGHNQVDTYEVPGVLGVAPAGLTRRNDRRVSTNDAYLEPARQRLNLEIRGDLLVDRVIVENGRAVAVRTPDGDIRARQIAISAGAIHSPAILLRSGLGERRSGIGQNLGEHPCITAFVTLRSDAIDKTMSCPSTGCLLRWSSGLAGCGEGDLQILPINHIDPADPAAAWLLAAVMEPFSRGVVRLASDDPEADPVVEFNLMNDPGDAARMRLVAEELCAIVANSAIASVAASVALDVQGTQPSDIADPVALAAWLRSSVTDYVHAVGYLSHGLGK